MGWPLERLATLSGAEPRGAPDTEVSALCTPDRPVPGGLGFALSGRAAAALSAGGAYVLSANPGEGPGLAHDDPRGAFARLVEALLPRPAAIGAGVHPRAEVAAGATIHPTAGVGPFCVVGEGAKVAAGCRLHPFSYLGDRSEMRDGACLLPHAVVMEDCVVGEGAVIGPGSVVGAQGFGLHGAPRTRLPHRGGVRVGRGVGLGANNTVDAGLLDPTMIGEETQTDGLVHVAHNVSLGKRAALAAQTGIAGSTEIGDEVTTGGQVGIGDHLQVANRVVLGGGSSLVQNAPNEGEVMVGYPARNKALTLRIWTLLKRLPELFRRK